MNRCFRSAWGFVSLLAVGLVVPASTVAALELEDPESFEVVQTWTGTSLGVPGLLGAMMFSEDGNTLYVVGNCEQPDSALYAVAVTRDPATGRVLDLGPAASTTLVFSGTATGLDTGLEIGPDGTLFYTYWDANRIAQRPGGFGGIETLYEMFTPGVPSSVAGLTFSPHIEDTATNFGQMQVSSWQETLSAQSRDIYNIPLIPVGGGLFEPGSAELFVTLPQQGTGAIQYVPSGVYEGDLMYVNWDFGEVRVLNIDPDTGWPIDVGSGMPMLGTDDPVDERFAYDMGMGPWGLEFDARSNDFFVSTWQGEPFNSIIQFSGVGFSDGDAGSDGGGCGCSVLDRHATVHSGLLFGIVALAWLARRRRSRAR